MHPLREARRARGLSMKELADRIGICERTVWAAEQGKPLRIDSIRLICAYFEQPATALGLVCQQHNELSDPAPEEDTIRRREALQLMGGGSLTMLSSAIPFTTTEALAIARMVLNALWRISEAEQVGAVEQIASLLLGFLTKHPALNEGDRLTAALIAETHLILATAARHLMRPDRRTQQLWHAWRYAELADDTLLRKAVLDYRGFGCVWGLAPGTDGYQPEPQAALLCFQQALVIRGGPASPAMKASLLRGLAEAYSLLQEPRKATKTLVQAEAHYAATSAANDPGYTLADCAPYGAVLCRARILLNLGQGQMALQALEESQRLYLAQWPGSRGRGLADLQPKRAAVALALNDQDLFREAMSASMEAVQRSGSRYGRAEAQQLLQQGQARWPQLRDLAHWKEQLGWLAS